MRPTEATRGGVVSQCGGGPGRGGLRAGAVQLAPGPVHRYVAEQQGMLGPSGGEGNCWFLSTLAAGGSCGRAAFPRLHQLAPGPVEVGGRERKLAINWPRGQLGVRGEMNESRPGWPEPAPGVELLQVQLVVHVEPLGTEIPRGLSCPSDEGRTNALPPHGWVHRGIQEEGVCAAVPRHMDEAYETSVLARGDPSQAAGKNGRPVRGPGLLPRTRDQVVQLFGADVPSNEVLEGHDFYPTLPFFRKIPVKRSRASSRVWTAGAWGSSARSFSTGRNRIG